MRLLAGPGPVGAGPSPSSWGRPPPPCSPRVPSWGRGSFQPGPQAPALPQPCTWARASSGTGVSTGVSTGQLLRPRPTPRPAGWLVIFIHKNRHSQALQPPPAGPARAGPPCAAGIHSFTCVAASGGGVLSSLSPERCAQVGRFLTPWRAGLGASVALLPPPTVSASAWHPTGIILPVSHVSWGPALGERLPQRSEDG